MKRYVSVARSAAGKTTVTVSLVDGDISSKYAAQSYVGDVAKATVTADKYARQNMQDIKDGLDALEESGGLREAGT